MAIKGIMFEGRPCTTVPSSGIFYLTLSPSRQRRVRSSSSGRLVGHRVVGSCGRRVVRPGRCGRVRGGGYVGRLLRLGHRCGGR